MREREREREGGYHHRRSQSAFLSLSTIDSIPRGPLVERVIEWNSVERRLWRLLETTNQPRVLPRLYRFYTNKMGERKEEEEEGGTTSVVQTWCRVCMTGRSSSATSLDFFFFFNWFFSSLHPSCCCCCSTESGRSREPAHTQRALMSWSESLDWSTSRAG